MKNNKIFDFEIVTLTVITTILLIPIFSLIHESGHGLICMLDGKDFVFGITIFGGWLTCTGVINDPTLFRLMGGLLTSIVAFGTFAILKSKLVGNLKFIAIALVTMGIGEFFAGLMEGFANDFYMHSKLSGAASCIVILTVLMILLYRESKFIKEQKEMLKNEFGH